MTPKTILTKFSKGVITPNQITYYVELASGERVGGPFHDRESAEEFAKKYSEDHPDDDVFVVAYASLHHNTNVVKSFTKGVLRRNQTVYYVELSSGEKVNGPFYDRGAAETAAEAYSRSHPDEEVYVVAYN